MGLPTKTNVECRQLFHNGFPPNSVFENKIKRICLKCFSDHFLMTILVTLQKQSLGGVLLKIEAVLQSFSGKKVFLEISQNSQENTCARVSFLIKLQA